MLCDGQGGADGVSLQLILRWDMPGRGDVCALGLCTSLRGGQQSDRGFIRRGDQHVGYMIQSLLAITRNAKGIREQPSYLTSSIFESPI